MEKEGYSVERGTKEWAFMWKALATHKLNKGVKSPRVALHEGEAWQCFSTQVEGGKLCYTFRHRYHPKTKQREHIFIPVPKEFLKKHQKKQ